MNLAEPLRAGLHALGLDELQACAPRLLDYLALLAKWNKVYNLTAVRELERMLPQHLLDSLAVLPYIMPCAGEIVRLDRPQRAHCRVANCLRESDHAAQFAPCIASRWEQSNPDNFPRARHKASNLLDVGSGAGLPGIPLAIAMPELQVTLLDSNHKKTAFLRQACIELGLANVTVICERVETWQAPNKFDIIISRAFSELAAFAKLSGHLCAPGGVLLAMKGVRPLEEAELLSANVVVEEIIPLKVPALEAERHLVVMRVT